MSPAERDHLTGIAGRRGFLRQLAAADGTSVDGAVLVVDLDNFHLVNTLLGIERGDDVLRLMAARLSRLANPHGVPARLGSDQFAIWAPGLGLAAGASADEGVQQFAQRVLDAVCQPFTVSGDEGKITCSIGYALTDAGSAIDALQAATAAASNAKRHGLATILAHDEATLAENLRRYTIQADLPTAVAHGELRVHFQPEVDLRTGQTVGVEALARWEHPELGAVSPNEFIQIAETAGLITPIGEYVLDVVAGEATRWTTALHGRPLTLWFNLSAVQLSEPERLIESVRAAVTRHQLPAGALGAEVTETAVMSDIREARRTLQRLRELGLEIAVDDFGAGHASWPYLWQIPATVLKIDRTFASDLLSIPEGLAMTEAVIDLAHTFRLRVVAEGVETIEQATMLARLGADRAQGHLFSPDVAAAELPRVATSPWAGGTAHVHRPSSDGRTRVSPGFHGRHASVLVDALDASNDAVVLVDRLPSVYDGGDATPRVVFANRAFERLVGVDLDGLRDRPLLHVLPALGSATTALLLDDARDREVGVTVEVEHRRPNGQLSWIEISFGPRRGLDLTAPGAESGGGRDESVIGWIAIARDVTRRHSLELEAAQRAQLDEVTATNLPADATIARLGELFAADVVTLVTTGAQGRTVATWHHPAANQRLDPDDERIAAAMQGDVVVSDEHACAIPAVLAVPLLGAQRIRGVLALGRLVPRTWTAAELSSARRAAEALARIEARREIQASRARTTAMDHVCDGIVMRALGADLDAFVAGLDGTCELIASAMGVDCAQIDLIDTLTGELSTVASAVPDRLGDRVLRRFHAPLLRQPATAAAMHASHPMAVEDRTTQGARWLRERAEVRHEVPMGAGVMAPLVSGGKPLGALVLGHESPRAFGSDDVAALSLVARTVASELARLTAERDLHETEDRFRLIAEHGSDVISLVSAAGFIEFVSSAALDVLGWSPDDVRRTEIVTFLHPDDREGAEFEVREAVRQRRSARIAGRARRRDGSFVWTETMAQPSFDPDGTVRNWVAITRDVTDQHSIAAVLNHRALHDELTGVATHAVLVDRLDHAAERLARQAIPFSVAMLDIDDLERINSHHGRAVRDEVVRTAAMRISSVLRSTDLLARLGEDELVVVCASELAGATAVLDRVLATLAEPIQVDGQSIVASVSAGLVGATPGSGSPALLNAARVALARAKQAGGARLVLG
jgi:diguanylate cyclase (GGDEF)-like protein/PAS domain S-box-containing protein